MIALAAAATTVFAFGAGTAEGANRDKLVNDFGGWTGTSFEALTEGSVNVGDIVGKDDTGNQDGENKFWYSAATETDELGAITNEAAGAGVSRPDAFSTQGNTKSLQIDTTSPLFRTALPNSSGVQPVDIGDGIYLDTLVKFTAADEAFAENLTGGDKIAIEYVEHEAEGDDVGYTNFVVRAGLIGEELGQTNYFAAVPANFNKDEWHRLTVRTIADVGDGNVGFVVYLDGDIDKTLKYSTTVDAGFGTLNATAAKFYNNEKHALFPSAVNSGDNKLTISSVAFSGSGFIDDVSFAAEAPQFIKAGEAVPVEITLGTGVTGVTVTIGENAYNPVDATATPLVFNLPAGTTSFDLAVTADADNGYTFDGATGITAEYASYNNGTVTISGAAPALTVVGTRNNVTYIDGNGDSQSSPSLATAIAGAKAGSTIVLAYPINVTDVEGAEFVTYEISGKDIVLDLNGNTITWNDELGEEALFSVKSGASFRVIDSSAANTGAIVYTGEYVVFYNKGDCYIGATTGDKGPTIQGKLAAAKAEPQIVRGKFDKATNTKSAEFTWMDYIEEGSELVESLGDYWVVEPQGGSEPTEIAVPTAESNLVYNGTEQTGVAAGTGYTLTGVTAATDAGEYTATATPVSGYAWVGGSTDATNITWSIAKASVTATVSLTVTEATYDSTKTTVTDYTTPSVNFGLDAPELVENIDYTVAWSATEVTGAGTFTYTVSPVAGSNYMFTETSATLTITAGGAYPTYIENITDPTTKAAYEAKYDTWKATYGADTESAYEEAFLLNCSTDAAVVAAEKAAFKFTSISYDATQSKWITTTTTKNTSNADYNGTVVVKQYSDVGCKTESSTGTFFKAFLQ